MFNKIVEIAKSCDSQRKWTDEDWRRTLENCILKKQFILKTKNYEVTGFACWLFLRDLNKVNGQFVEDTDGEIAYIQCGYAKEDGMLHKMLREGITRHPHAKKLLWYNDRLNDTQRLFNIRR